MQWLMGGDFLDIDTLQQPMPLLLANRQDFARHLPWPAELVFFKSLVPQAKAGAIPVQYF